MDLAKEVTCRQTFTLGRDAVAVGSRLRPAGRAATSTSSPSTTAPSATSCAASRRSAAGDGRAGDRHRPTTSCAIKPDGVFLSNGPGDPAATGEYAVPVIRELIDTGMPIFGICLGHQMLALALGGTTDEDAPRPPRRQPPGQGPHHRQGRDHQPEPRLRRRPPRALPADVDGDARVAVRRHQRGLPPDGQAGVLGAVSPEASPGPQDSHYLFERFVGIDGAAARRYRVSEAARFEVEVERGSCRPPTPSDDSGSSSAAPTSRTQCRLSSRWNGSEQNARARRSRRRRRACSPHDRSWPR